MIRSFLYSAVLMACLNILVSAQTTVKIIELRKNDSSGIPEGIGNKYKISGVVTSTNQFGTSGPGTLQDETAGISIYGSRFAGEVNIGDSVSIIGELTHYRGLTEMDVTKTGTFVIKNGAGIMKDPILLTIADITGQEWNGTELYEGSLIRLNKVTVSGSGKFSGGSNYNISDSTGTMEMRIDNDVASIIGTSLPSGEFDLIGIAGQYAFSSPYEGGYQILPRFIDDLLYESAPMIQEPIIFSNINTNSFTVNFVTAREGDTQVKFGLTHELEIDSLYDGTQTKNHFMKISNLEPLTKYYVKVFSENSTGISESKIYSVTTANPNPEAGEIHIYFNSSADKSVAIPGNEADDNVDFSDKLKYRINQTSKSLDMAVYSFFGLDDVADAIIAAKNRGVRVRVVYHNRDTQSSMQRMINAGVRVFKRTDESGLMHNKFAIFDFGDEDVTNDWIWTGSWNWTSTELDWRNNVVEINNSKIAEAYTLEFEEMWGDTSDMYNPSTAKFGDDKKNNTPHNFQIGTSPVQIYFSPADTTEKYIINNIAGADSSLYFALLAFTSDGIFNQINSRHSAGVENIRGLISDANIQGSEFNNLQSIGDVFDYDYSTGKLHHKYGIIDASAPSSDPTVITGSHNWSRSANEKNDENTLIIHDVYIANQFMQEFKKRFNEMGGTGIFNVPIITGSETEKNLPEGITLYQNYPNPFNPVTTISFSLAEREFVELKLFNVLGEEVKKLFVGEMNAGRNTVDLNANQLPSGVYYYTLKVDGNFFTKKCVLLK